MKNGISLHIGINNYDPSQYGNSWTPLVSAKNDAIAMEQLAQHNGFESHLLLNDEATTDSFLNFLDQSSKKLKPGDYLLVSFSGHGSFITDRSPNRFESPIDLKNEIDHVLCFHDKMLIDDRIKLEFVKFETGVRILFIFDSCYSAGIIDTFENAFLKRGDLGRKSSRPRNIDQTALSKNLRLNKDLYDSQKQFVKDKGKSAQDFDILLVAACEANEKAYEDDQHGHFTRHLLEIWESGFFSGDIIDLYELTKLSMKQSGLSQTPRLLPYSRFTNKRAFVI